MGNISSNLSMPIVLLGILFGATGLMNVGIILFSLVVVLQLGTLPVEFDASKRACSILENSVWLSVNEKIGVKKVLQAVAMTYLASALKPILQLIRLIGMPQNRGIR